MRSSIRLVNGDEWYIKYVYQNDHQVEMTPFQTDCFDKPIYLPDNSYELENGGIMTIKNKNVDFIRYDNKPAF